MNFVVLWESGAEYFETYHAAETFAEQNAEENNIKDYRNGGYEIYELNYIKTIGK